MMVRRAITLIAGFSAAFAVAGAAFAAGPGEGITTLPVGSPGVTPSGSTAAASQNLLATISNESFTAATFSGLVTENVYQNTSNGDLTFTYQFTNNSGSPDGIARMSVSNYSPMYTTDVSQLANGGTVSSDSADRLIASGGNVVGWDFFKGVGQGAQSYLLIITTDAKAYGNGQIAFQDGSNVTVRGLAPTVPEPGTIAAFVVTGLGIFLLAATSRKRQLRYPV
jgi:hypothetical protein